MKLIKKPTYKIALIGIISTVYAVLTVSLGSIGYSWLQIRLSEALTPLPFIIGFPAAIGLTLGCAISNCFSPVGIPDLIFGPLLTLFAALLSWKFSFNRRILACIYPIVVNAFGVSAYVSLFYSIPYWMGVLTIGLGEFVSCMLIGYPLLLTLEKTKL